jgi:hypothetical protein
MTLSRGPKVQPKRSTFSFASGVEEGLELDVERARPDAASIHWAEDLHVADGIEPEALGIRVFASSKIRETAASGSSAGTE